MNANRNPSDLIIVGIKGTVIALDVETGNEVWRTPLKGSQFTNITLDRGLVFAAARGEVFCLDAATGRLFWSNPLTGMGWGIVTFATAAQAPAAAQQLANEAAAASAAAT